MGAADRALVPCSTGDDAVVQCASLKSNMGHLEAAAAAAGLASLAESLRDRCRRLVLLKGERLRS